MLSRLTRYTLLFALTMTAFAALPQSSDAQVGWYNPATGVWQTRAFRPLWPWRRGFYSSTVYSPVARRTTVYRPVIAYRPIIASSCNTCSPCATTVRYAPQTSYRPQIVSVPTVAYQQVQTFDSCTGCRQTVLRPITTYVQQVRQVAYTTYRPIYTSSCSTCSTCASPCSTCGIVGCTSCTTSTCASGQCGTGSTTFYTDATTTNSPAAGSGVTGNGVTGNGLARPSLLQDAQKTEAQKVPTDTQDNSNLQPELDTSDMQEIDGARLQKYDAPALLNPNDRQARSDSVQRASYQQKVQPRLPVKWTAVK